MKFNKLTTIILAGGLAAASSMVAFASSTDTTVPEQTAKYGKARAEMKGKGGMQKCRIGKGNFADQFKSLVQEGIISQEQADQWVAFHEQKAAERQAEMEKVKAMTEEERKAYFEEKKASFDGQKPERPDPFSEVVAAGIITQEQADQIKEKMPARPDKAIKLTK